MKMRWSVVVVYVCGLVLFAACSIPTGGRVIGGQPIQITELSTYPGATELNSAESKIIEPLFGAAQRETPPFIGLGIEVEKAQRNFRVPRETTFADVKAFYADKLLAGGWREDAAMREFTSHANAQMKNMQGAVWVRIDQTMLIVLATDANGDKELMLSLATR